MTRRNLVTIALWCVCFSASARIFVSASCWGSSIHGATLSPSKRLYEAGDEVTVTCNSYGITERKKIACTTVRWWTEWVPNLENYCGNMVSCDAGDNIVHPKIYTTPGYVTWYKSGEKVTLHCPEGYDLTGTKETTCLSGSRFGNGYFSPGIANSGCRAQPAICKLPSSVTNGVLSPPKLTFSVGETVSLSCDPKYIPDGPSKSTCIRRTPPTPGAKWDFKIKGCKRDPKTICKLENIQFRNINQKKDMYEVGETISLSCHDLYTSDDAQESTCMAGTAEYTKGYWEPKFSDCKPDLKVSCGLKNFPNMMIEPKKELYGVGDVISIQCSEGYASAGPLKATCMAGENGENSSWEPKVQECERVGCEAHPWITNGDFEPFKWSYEIGEEIDIVCEVDTEVVGSSHSKCEKEGHTGAWKPMLGKCIRNKCRPPTVTGANISPEFDAYNIGDTIDVFCITARTGTLPVQPSASSVCTKSGDDLYPTFDWKPSVRDTCDDQICLHSSWSFNEKINPKHDFYLPGESIDLSCRDGFTAQGETKSVCTMKDGKAEWKPVIGQCIKDNCNAPHVYGATIEPAKGHYLPGETIKVICTIHTDIEPKETKCRTSTSSWGHWEPDLQNYCGKQIGCDMQQMSIHPKMYTVPRIVTWLSPGEQVTLHCIDGYEVVGVKTSTCTAGVTWGQGYYDPDVTKSSCKEIPLPCDPPTAPQNGQLSSTTETYIVGDEVSLTCDEKYIPDGATKSSCARKDATSKDTYWDPPIGTCKRDPQFICNAPASPLVLASAGQMKDFYEVGETITVTCLKGFKPSVSWDSTCEYDDTGKAEWDLSDITCVEILCDPPPPPLMVAQPSNKYPVGVKISVFCVFSYLTMVGSSTNTCSEKHDTPVWDPPLGHCVTPDRPMPNPGRIDTNSNSKGGGDPSDQGRH